MMTVPKSVFIHTRRWHDKTCGTNYFASRVEVGTGNYYYVPFQYGYEEADIDAVVKVLQNAGYEVERKQFNTTGAPFDHYRVTYWSTKKETKGLGEDN
jgi:hypothetical protein